MGRKRKIEKASSIAQLAIRNPTEKVYCEQCDKEITKHVKMVDLGSQLMLCVPCFARLDPLPREYSVISKLSFGLFESDWNCEEEILLFEGLKKYGFGNWKEIGNHIGGKTGD
jgi:transcriptional adapter 2-alpha